MAPQSRKTWDLVAETTVLAWLDFCLENGIEFNKTVHQKLLEATGNEFSNVQISRCFCSLVKSYLHPRGNKEIPTPIPEENPVKISLRKSGSVILQGLSAEQKARILAAKQNFKVCRTRDSVKHDHRISEDLKRGKNDARAKKRYAHDEDAEYIQGNVRPSTSPLSSIAPTPEPNQMNETTTRCKGLATYAHCGSSDSHKEGAISRVEGQAKKRLKTNEDRVTNNAPDQNLVKLLKEKDAQIVRLRAEWRQEVDEGLEREDRLRKLEQKLLNDNRHLEIARDERQRAGRDPLEDMIYLKNREIWFLTKRVQETESLCKYVRVDTEEQPTIEQTEVAKTMKTISSELDSILHGHIQHGPVLLPTLYPGTDLGELIRCILGPDSEPSQQKLELGRWIRGFELDIVIRTLTAAALKVWVFDNPFFRFPTTQAPLLRSYREILLTLGGWRGLHGIELAAYQHLIKNPRFETETIPKEAEKLAMRLSSAFSPLFVREANTSTPMVFETWGQLDHVVESRRFCFQQIFEAGLLLRASTILTDHRYEFEVNRPGIHNPSDDLAVGSSRPSSQTWLLASLSVYPPSQPGSGDKFTDALRQSKNFFSAASLKESQKCYTEHLLIPKHEPWFPMLDDSELRSPTEERQCIQVLSTLEQNTHGTNSDSTTDVDASKPPSPEIVTCGSDRRTRRLSSKARKLASYDEDRDSTESVTESDFDKKPEWRCKTCGKQFSSAYQLRKHRKNWSCNKCLPCGIVFGKNKEKRQQHFEDVHGAEKTPRQTEKSDNSRCQHDPFDKSIPATSITSKKPSDPRSKDLNALNPDIVETEGVLKVVYCSGCDTKLSVDAFIRHQRGGVCQEWPLRERGRDDHVGEALSTSIRTNKDNEKSSVVRSDSRSEEGSSEV